MVVNPVAGGGKWEENEQHLIRRGMKCSCNWMAKSIAFQLRVLILLTLYRSSTIDQVAALPAGAGVMHIRIGFLARHTHE